MTITTPNVGDADWGDDLNNAILDISTLASTGSPMRNSGGYIQYQDKVTGAWVNLIATSSLQGTQGTIANLTSYGVRPTIFYGVGGWPVRTVPEGYAGSVIWDSSSWPSAGQPPAPVNGDSWYRRRPVSGGTPTTITIPARTALVWGTDKPSENNTGLLPGTDPDGMPVLTGDQTITVAGTTLSGQRIKGRVVVQAANVTITNCYIEGPAAWTATGATGLVDATSAACTGLTISDCFIAPQTPRRALDGVLGHDFTLLRSNVQWTVNGVSVANTNTGATTGAANVTVQQSYIHHLFYYSPDPNETSNHTENNGILVRGNTTITIRGNTIDAIVSNSVGNGFPNANPTATVPDPYYPSVTGSAVNVYPTVSAVTGLTITKNWLRAGLQGITVAPGSINATTTTASITSNVFYKNTNPLIAKDSVSARRPILASSRLTIATLPTTTGADISTNKDEDGAAITVYRIDDGGTTTTDSDPGFGDGAFGSGAFGG